MSNTLVVCGGTGAHVALALLRLHTLGHALGFFRHADDKPLAFPTLYLVDQDSGDGAREATAWQEAKRLVARHPGRHDWNLAIGRSDPPERKVVTPLPIGSKRTWFDPPFDTLRRRFADSPWLDLLTSQGQRGIRFSHGMMGSPAVGSLLFRLKDFDRKQSGTNHDGAYHELLSARGRVAVVGSAVGGTGAAVGPTLAQRLADSGAAVMAVMVLNWFRFDPEDLDEETLEKAQLRDRSMVENANSAFAYYGSQLARRVATVPVGVPDAAVKLRRYTSDTRQPIQESLVHGVAALCTLQHFLAVEPPGPGLYQMGAEDPARLGGGNRLPGRTGDDSVQSLANQAATLADVLDVFAGALAARHSGAWLGVAPAIHDATRRIAAPERVGDALGRLVTEYREHLDWMERVLGVRPQPDESLTPEARSRARLAGHDLEPAARADTSREDAAALALFHWTADWIADWSREEDSASLIVAPARSPGGGYWPPLVGPDSLNVSVEHAGTLTRVADQSIQGTVEGFIVDDRVTENGWPDPLAAADHFRYAILREQPAARRQLEMLLASIVMGKLRLREVRRPASPPTLSLDHLVDEARTGRAPDIASVALVYGREDDALVLGFNSPYTLLCPTPTDRSDEARENAWGRLWQTLTGSDRPRDWRTEEIEWRHARSAIRQIRAWIEAEKRAHGGAPPPWTSIFQTGSAPPSVPFGRGRALTVYWDPGAEPPPVTVWLPTAEAGNYWPDGDTLRISEDELLARESAVRTLQSGAGVQFEMVEFELPDREARVRAFWREHLEQLQQSGAVAAFGARPDDRQVAFLTADRRAAAVLDNVIVLDRDVIMIRECCPMRQTPVQPVTPGRILYPNYPLRSDYAALVETDDGRCVVDLLKDGERVPPSQPSVDDVPSGRAAGRGPREQTVEAARRLVSEGRRVIDRLWRGESSAAERPPADYEPARQEARATWSLRLAGRSDRVGITLPVPSASAPDAQVDPHRAHWMVWPRFRSTTAPYWRAYYVYERCTDARLHLRTLWLDPDHQRLRRAALSRTGSQPIRFAPDQQRVHTGGPPLAFSLENGLSGQELGLYVINLDRLPRRDADVKVGLDFGTSHTVAAVETEGEKHLVELTSELTSDARHALTHHVSEDRTHVMDAYDDDGLKALGIWQPTYTDAPVQKEQAGLLPAELLTIETIQELVRLHGDRVAQWQPGRDFVIPYMDMQRRDLADHLLSDFKLESSVRAFQGQEPALREVYLGMATELVMAEVVWRRLHALPERVDFTFTYPLRSPRDEVKGWERTVRSVLDSGGQSLGSTLQLANDIGIYNESSAAKGGTHRFGEVCLVGDLGGGTLDLFISAYGGPGVEFEEVADSAKLGGNALLRTMAEHPDRFLPHDWTQANDVNTLLRAWMRSKGAARLFGDGTTPRERLPGLDVRGFAQPGDATAARALIGRYFRLIVEYMSRNLAAYLVRHWYPRVLESRPEDHGVLRVLVQLRGNGWRLWHETDDYAAIEAKIAADVGARTAELWRDRAGHRDAWRGLDLWRTHLWTTAGEDGGGPAVGPPKCAPEGSRAPNPKAAPILNVVGLAQRHDEIHCSRYALVQLAVRTHPAPAGGGSRTIHWFDRLPVDTGGGTVKVEFDSIEPPLSLSHPQAAPEARQELDDLEPELKREINRALEKGYTGEVNYSAPIAELVWERAFRSRRFVRGKR